MTSTVNGSLSLTSSADYVIAPFVSHRDSRNAMTRYEASARSPTLAGPRFADLSDRQGRSGVEVDVNIDLAYKRARNTWNDRAPNRTTSAATRRHPSPTQRVPRLRHSIV
jgi:hypothetical protein